MSTSLTDKYGKTLHFDFSPGTNSDDRINLDWYKDMQIIETVIDLEKMDGENTCMKGTGKFARSHAAPTKNPWSEFLNVRFAQIQRDLADTNIEIFGENLYAIHSIIYPNLDDHFKVFAVRHLDMWLGWEEVKWYAEMFDFHTVPEFGTYNPSLLTAQKIEQRIVVKATESSTFGSLQVGTNHECTMEGIVTRNFNEFPVEAFQQNVFKYVRRGHVQTDQHWVRNWKRAPLITDKLTNKF